MSNVIYVLHNINLPYATKGRQMPSYRIFTSGVLLSQIMCYANGVRLTIPQITSPQYMKRHQNNAGLLISFNIQNKRQPSSYEHVGRQALTPEEGHPIHNQHTTSKGIEMIR